MSKKVTITGKAAVCVTKYMGFDPAEPQKTKAGEFAFLPADHLIDGKLPSHYTGGDYPYTLVGLADISIELISHDEMVSSAVASLEAQKQYVLAEAQAKVTRIEGEIQKLLAITYEAS